MKPTSRLHRGFVAATLGLSASLSLPVAFSDTVLLAQNAVPAPVSASESIPPVPASQQIRVQASQKLHAARKAVAARDLASAERLLGEVQTLQLTYHENEDQPALIEGLIKKAREISELSRTRGNTEQFRRQYAMFNLMQADTMLRRNELDLAVQLTQEAAKQQVLYNQEEKNNGLEPGVMLQRIETARRAKNLHTPIASSQIPQPLSQAAQEQAKQAAGLLELSRKALQAGQIDQAERLAGTAASYQLPDYAFSANETPHRVLTEIAARRQGTVLNAVPANPQPASPKHALYQQAADQSQTIQTSGSRPSMAPPIPAPVPVRTAPFIDRTLTEKQAVLSQISSEIMQHLADAQRVTREQRKPEAALNILQNAKLKIEQSPQLDAETRKMYVAQIDRAIEETISFMDGYSTQEKQNQVNDAVRAELRQEAVAFKNKEEQLSAMFKEHQKLTEEQRYEEALRLAKKAKEFAPEEPAVQTMLTMSQLVYNINRSQMIEAQKRDGVVETLLAVDGASTIPVGIADNPMLYSQNWDELTRRRQSSNEGLQYRRPESERQIMQRLERPVTLNEPQPIPLEQALNYLSQQAGIPIYLDEAGLREADVMSSTMIKMPIVSEAMVKSVLNTILAQHGLAYTVKNELLNITTIKRAKGEKVVRYYNVMDLRPVPRTVEHNTMEDAFNRSFQNQLPRQPNVQYGSGNAAPVNTVGSQESGDPNVLAQYGGGYGGMSGGMGSGMSGNYNGGGAGYGTNSNSSYSGGGQGTGMDFSDIVTIITSVIEPESWVAAGGDAPDPAFHLGTQSLAIRQTEEVHAQIEDLLTQIRKMNDLQVAVEVRYITLSDSFYERMGTSFDAIFRNDNALGRVTQISNTLPGGEEGSSSTTSTKGDHVTIGLRAPGDFTVDASIPFQQDSFGLAIPAFGGYNPSAGISTGFALLSDIEAYFFISAAQGDRRNSVMEAPKVMLHNGQMGVVQDYTQIPFVTSVVPVVADFAIGYQPIITTLNQGQILKVEATVSHDRQHVRLTLNPTFTTVTKIEEFKYFGDDSETEETETSSKGDDKSTASTDERNNNTRKTVSRSGLTIQQPQLATFLVSTTVNCPDGGTVLLGGIKRLSEGRVEAGVPMLNKIPYVQRLFSNTAIGRDTQSVMMMVTPRIIIQEEEENFIMGAGNTNTP